jgi:putative transposase
VCDGPRFPGSAGPWRRRFRAHHAQAEADFEAHLRYCRINPVKHRLVGRAAEWPHSSIHRAIARGLVEPEWAGSAPPGKFGE